MIRVATGSRLHFGVFHLPGRQEAQWADRHGEPRLPVRRFGGVGLMVEAPGVQLTVSPAATWSAEGPLFERALAFAQRFGESSPGVTTHCHLRVDRCAPEHAGLGTGTQLGLAIARALAAQNPDVHSSTFDLATRVHRGARSALGIHGFAEGGFLIEAGQREQNTIAPLVCRTDFPSSWRVLLILPQSGSGLHGGAERLAFEALPPMPETCTNALCRLALLGMLPAIQEADLRVFGEALHDFNARVGEAFAPVQGGIYASSMVAEVVAFLRAQGVCGVGQSSWGPTVYAVLEDEDQAQHFESLARKRFLLRPGDALVTRGRNLGALCDEH